MKLILNKLNYHNGRESIEENKFIHQLLNKLKKLDNECFKNIDKDFACKILKAIIHENINIYNNLLSNEIYNDILEHFKFIYPFILKNEREISSKRCFLYEPNIVMTYYKILEFQSKINNVIENYNGYELYFWTLFNNFIRSSRAIITLLAMGDDAHAMALFRGFLEQLCKILFLIKYGCHEDFVFYNELNEDLQYYKYHPGVKASNKLWNFKKENNLSLTSSKMEYYLLYNWMKTKNKTITNGVELIELFYGNIKEIMNIYHMTSEFVHEDYILIDYNFIYLRKKLSTFISVIINIFDNERIIEQL